MRNMLWCIMVFQEDFILCEFKFDMVVILFVD
jgi:hypothetical protein